MNRLQQIKSSRTRQGKATLEFALIFPFFVAVMLGILTVASSFQSKTLVHCDARLSSFEHRHEPWRANGDGIEVTTLKQADLGAIDDIVGPTNKMPVNEAVITSKQSRQPRNFLPSRLSIGAVDGDATVLGGSWDFSEIEFQNHGRLELTEKANYFGPQIDVNAFAALRSLTGVTNNSAITGAQQKLDEAKDALERERKKIEKKSEEIDKQLKTEFEKPLPNLAASEEFNKQLRKLQEELKEIEDLQRQLESGLAGSNVLVDLGKELAKGAGIIGDLLEEKWIRVEGYTNKFGTQVEAYYRRVPGAKTVLTKLGKLPGVLGLGAVAFNIGEGFAEGGFKGAIIQATGEAGGALGSIIGVALGAGATAATGNPVVGIVVGGTSAVGLSVAGEQAGEAIASKIAEWIR